MEASICIFQKNMKEIIVLKETVSIEKPNLDRMLGVKLQNWSEIIAPELQELEKKIKAFSADLANN